MSELRIASKVRRCPVHAGCWLATAHVVATSEVVWRCAPSWAEAMQEAYALMQLLDRELMDAVHESRARRREAAPLPAKQHAWYANRMEKLA